MSNVNDDAAVKQMVGKVIQCLGDRIGNREQINFSGTTEYAHASSCTEYRTQYRSIPQNSVDFLGSHFVGWEFPEFFSLSRRLSHD